MTLRVEESPWIESFCFQKNTRRRMNLPTISWSMHKTSKIFLPPRKEHRGIVAQPTYGLSFVGQIISIKSDLVNL